MHRWALVLLMLGSLTSCDVRPNKHEWSLVSSAGNERMVYVSDAGFADKKFMSELLKYIVKRDRIYEVYFFDTNVFVPSNTITMTDAHKLHWRAKYVYNPIKGIERFDYVEVVDPRARPIVLRFIEGDIRPAP